MNQVANRRQRIFGDGIIGPTGQVARQERSSICERYSFQPSFPSKGLANRPRGENPMVTHRRHTSPGHHRVVADRTGSALPSGLPPQALVVVALAGLFMHETAPAKQFA